MQYVIQKINLIYSCRCKLTYPFTGQTGMYLKIDDNVQAQAQACEFGRVHPQSVIKNFTDRSFLNLKVKVGIEIITRQCKR